MYHLHNFCHILINNNTYIKKLDKLKINTYISFVLNNLENFGFDVGCQVHRDSTTNYCKLGSLKQQKFTVLEAIISKPRCCRSLNHPKALGENLFLVFPTFWWMQVFFDLWPQHSNVRMLLHIDFFSDSLCAFYKNICY